MGNCCKDKTRKGGAVLAAKKGRKEKHFKTEVLQKTYKLFLRQFVKNTKTAKIFQEKPCFFAVDFAARHSKYD